MGHALSRLAGAISFASVILLAGCGGGGSDGGPPPPPPLPPGTLDPAFGTNGIVQTTGITFYSNAILLQSDGKIVAPGSKLSGDLPNVTASIAIVRYNADGSLDSVFGTGGIASAPIQTGNVQTIDPVVSAALQADGKIVVLGMTLGIPYVAHQCVLARFNRDGTLDGSFGTAGMLFEENSDHSDCTSLSIQNDGKFLVSDSAFGVKRFNGDGSRDASFGVGGEANSTGISGEGTRVNSIVLQSDGRIVIIGWGLHFFALGGIKGSLLLTRYNADGTVDHGFGTAGIVTVDSVFASEPFLYASGALQIDGKIVVASGGGVVRFTTDGALDLGFGVAGIASAFAFFSPKAVALQSNGKIVVGGVGSATYPNPASEFMVIRLNTNGSLDPAFGTGGQVHTPIGAIPIATAIAVQSDGRIVVAGYTRVLDPPTTLALARYFGDPVP